MVAFDSELLKIDPGAIALGGAGESVLQTATESPDPQGPACQAAVLSYRTALMFRVLFTALVFAVSFAAAAALIYAIVTIIRDGLDVSAAVTGVSGVVGSGAAVFLGKKMVESIRVARQALQDVGRYCGSEHRRQLERS